MLNFRINYDKSKLQFLGGEDGTLTGWTFSTEGNGALWDGDKDYTTAGTVAKLRFTIAENATDGDVTVSLSALEAGNYNEQNVTFAASDGMVKIRNIT